MHIIGALFGWMIIMIIALLADVRARVRPVTQWEGRLCGVHAVYYYLWASAVGVCCCNSGPVLGARVCMFGICMGRRANIPNTSRRVRTLTGIPAAVSHSSRVMCSTQTGHARVATINTNQCGPC